ncbi:MAG: fibro-slime domain-containing protein [Fibrobacteria bacterium]|nr:fibro-slime domain-containing protein [Fibrobacteria bacterium]
MNRAVPSRWFLLMAMLAGNSMAAKVLLFLSPFGKTTVCLTGASYGYNACSDSSASRLHLNPDSWMEFDFASAPTSGIGINQGNWVWQSSEFRLDDLFAVHDTVWAIPDPYPAGKQLKLLTSAPETRIVMLWNPWETEGISPWMKNGNGAWGKLQPNATLPGWHTARIVGFTALSLQFSDSSRTRFLGSSGVSTSVGSDIQVDSIGKVSDTIWIRGAPETGPTRSIATSTRPESKVVMLFNPWSGIYPVQHPRITIGGNGPFAMSADANFCGWYGYFHFDRSPQVSFSNEKTGASFGKGGIGNATAIDLSALPGDTAWVHLSGGQVLPTSSDPGLRGLCEVSYLAATIRDFPSDRSNIEFAWGSGCERGGWGVVKGMVDSILGPDRKPVRSAHDTGSMIRQDWWERFGNRCTYDTTSPASKALIGDSGIATNWFRTVPGKNAETCRDIPLTLDSTGSYYVYDNQNYFPIDDFSRLPDGSANPYFDQIPGSDAKSHNYSFCLESHGDFEYRKGQVFKFSGDDDVWFFINNRLVVDLGGIHGAASDSVQLDSLGLVEDATYPFDFFFCERDPQGSDMMIRTTMNLRTNSSFRVTDTLRQKGLHDYDVYVSTSSGQGCRSISSVVHSTASVRLLGPSFAAPFELSTGSWYGGITVDRPGGRVSVDSAAISGLAAGTYTIQFRAEYDSSIVRQFTFEVPRSLAPKFVAPHPLSGPVGTTFPVEVASWSDSGLDSASTRFHIRASGGLLLFSDSTLQGPIASTDTLWTGGSGIPRRLWALAVQPGTWSLSIGSGTSDTADTWAPIVVLPYHLAFVDSLGRPFAETSPITLSTGKESRLRIGLFLGDSLCVSCSQAVALTASSPTLVLSTVSGGPAATVGTPNKGLLDLWIRGATAVDSASVSASLVSDGTIRATWTPIRIVGWRLQFLDSTGRPLSSPGGVELDPEERFHARIGLFFGDSLCIDCLDQIDIAPSDPALILAATSDGTAAGRLPLARGVADLWIHSPAPIASASLLSTLKSDPAVSASWSPISVTRWRLRFVNPSSTSDSMVPISQDVGSSTSILVQVWGRNAPCSTCAGTLELSASSTGIAFESPTGVATSSVPIVSGVASFSVRGLTPVDGDTIRLVADFGAALSGYPVSFRAHPPDSARMFDQDGDGRADSMVVHLHHRGAPGNQFQAAWPASAPFVPGDRITFLDSLTVGIGFSTSFGANETRGNLAMASYSWNAGEIPTTLPLRDGIPPVPVRAWMAWGDGSSTPDTLRVASSEPILATTSSPLLRIGAGSSLPDRADVRRILQGDTLLLLWNPSSMPLCPRPGDSIGFLPSVSDAFMNRPGPDGRKVMIEGRNRPPLRATYLDRDQDGRIDEVRLDLAIPQTGDLERYDVLLPGNGQTLLRPSQAARRSPEDSLTLRITLQEPFPFGWTSFPEGSWVRESGGPSIPSLDGAGPAIDTAFIRRTELPEGTDTLLVVPSEPLRGVPHSNWLTARERISGIEVQLPLQTPLLKGDTLLILMTPDSSRRLRIGDSLRWTDVVADAFGNAASTRWRPIGGTPRPLFLRLTKPRPLFHPGAPTASVANSLQLQVDASGRWIGWDHPGAIPGSMANSTCDTLECSGPTLEINEPVQLSLHLYDHMGVFVASSQVSLDPAVLPTDDRDRVRIRILWNARDERGGEVAPGIYLMRLVLRAKSDLDAAGMFNTVWKIGVLPPATP